MPVIVHEIEAVSAGLDALDEELGETEAEAAGPPPTVAGAIPPPDAEAMRPSEETPPPA